MIKDTSLQDQPLQQPSTNKRRLRKSGPTLAILVAGLAIATLAYPSIARWSSSELTIDAERLRVTTVERGEFIRDVSAQGQIVAAVRPVLFSPEDGRVTTQVRSGDKVEIGDIVAVVESPELLCVPSLKFIPEPGVLLSLGSGLMLLAWLDRRRRR